MRQYLKDKSLYDKYLWIMVNGSFVVLTNNLRKNHLWIQLFWYFFSCLYIEIFIKIFWKIGCIISYATIWVGPDRKWQNNRGRGRGRSLKFQITESGAWAGFPFFKLPGPGPGPGLGRVWPKFYRGRGWTGVHKENLEIGFAKTKLKNCVTIS